MDKYTCNRNDHNDHSDIETTDFCCIRHFAESVIDELFDSDEEFVSTSIIVNGDLAQDLIRLFLSVTMEDDDFVFHMGMLDFNSIEYDKEYTITLNTDHEVWCEPAFRDNEYGTGYVDDVAEHAYIFEDSDYKILDHIECDDITIFGFEEDEE